MSDLLLARLVRAHGGSRQRWRKLVGPIRLYSIATHPHCNWSASPVGSAMEIEAVERLADELRLTHPILTA